MDVREQLSHSNRHRGMCPNLPEVIQLLRGQRVFEEEEPVWLQSLSELDGLAVVQAFVGVVAELDCLTQYFARIPEIRVITMRLQLIGKEQTEPLRHGREFQ